ncbi:putative pentatricopeptide repeat-containing protein At5g59900 [Impatiens glandulifera]|uniref:putative pentatricopeptide repeat-containing protein At5g59900 n=1 Tax=Impatiens glandulifera TaxID=253017 RepID=UPI001FB14266|nr:putative pentatricopeptide repeat-containing protein At5g59900 [Impatiens glandulifera]
MKQLHRRSLLRPNFLLNVMQASTSTSVHAANQFDDDSFVAIVCGIIRGKQSWKIAFNARSISINLRPQHVEKVLIQTLDDSRLALRFFNFLGLHHNFNHSTSSFCILIHSLIQSGHVWPASSLLQTLILRGSNEPIFVFESLLVALRETNFSSTYGFDLLVQTYLRYKRVLDSVIVVRLMRDFSIKPEARTVSAVLNALIRTKQFELALNLFDEVSTAGLQPDPFMLTAAIKCLCELQDLERAKEMVKEMEESNVCELNIVTYNILIHGLCKGNRALEAIEIKNNLGRNRLNLKPDIVTYCTLIFGLCSIKELKMAEDLTIEMLELGFVPSREASDCLVDQLRRTGRFLDACGLVTKFSKLGLTVISSHVYNALICCLCENGSLDEAEDMIRYGLGLGQLPSDVTCETMISSFCKVNIFERAFVLFGKLKEAGMNPTVLTYNSVINGHCKSGNLSLAESLFGEMIDNRGVPPNLVTYTSLISGFVNLGHIDKAFSLYHEMTGKGISPNVYTYTSLICGLFRAKMVTEADKMFREMKESGVIPNAVTYNVMIDGYCEDGEISKAFELFNEMVGNGLKPDNYTYRALIGGLCSTGNLSEAEKLVKGLGESKFKLNEICYTELLHCYCKEGRLKDALALFRNMEVADLICYSVLIHGSLKQNDAQTFLQLLKKIHVRGLKPDIITYSGMIDTYSKRGDLKKAYGVLDIMVTERCAPNTVTYTSLINGLCKVGFLDSAEKLLKEMVRSGSTPNEFTYGCLLNGLTKNGSINKAVELHGFVIGNYLANAITYNILIRGFCRVGRVEEGIGILLDMVKNGISPDCISYSTVIFEYCKNGCLSEALELWNKMMTTKRIVPDVIAYNILIYGCCLAGRIAKAIELRDEMVRMGLKPNQATYNAFSCRSSSGRLLPISGG